MSSTTAKPEETILIAVMGLTGTGKSTFINLASGSDLRVGHSVASCTSTVDVAQPFNLDGRDITLYDTPGFNDTNLSETEILKIIASELETRYRNNYKLHGIIYMHRISDIRVGGLEKSNFGVFRKLCGETSLKNVVIVTNMWSRVPSTEEGERRARELETMDDFFKPAILKGARFMHHREETVESAHDIIRSILKNHPVALDLQTQLVDEHRPIDKTSAGMEVGKKFTDIVAKYEKKLREQMQAAKQAQKRSAEMRQLQKEAQKAKDAIAKLEAERANQAKENERLRKQMEEMEERRKREAALRIVTGTIKSGHLHTIRSTSSNAYQGVNIRNSYIDGYNSYTGISQQQWIITKYGTNWRVQSAYNQRHLCFSASGPVYVSSEPHEISLSQQGAWNEFKVTQVCNGWHWLSSMVISDVKGSASKPQAVEPSRAVGKPYQRL